MILNLCLHIAAAKLPLSLTNSNHPEVFNTATPATAQPNPAG
jgi:hypothetical protein